MEDICNFIPPKQHHSELEFVHFVCETGIRKLHQPFSHFFYRMVLVFKGTAVLNTEGKRIPVKRGDVFLTFPYQSYEIDYDDEFCYFYISFCGDGAGGLLESLDLTRERFRYTVPENVVDFWVDSVRRVNGNNANTLTESVLMYTLSYLETEERKESVKSKDKFDLIIDYVNHNFASHDLSLRKIADLFYYSEKHLSYLFTKRMGVRFTRYVSDLRIHYAAGLMKNGERNIAEIALKCGFSDRFYFSKAFRKQTGYTPSQYLSIICARHPGETEGKNSDRNETQSGSACAHNEDLIY